MPFRLQKAGAGWVVVNSDTGRAHSKKPLTRTRAKAQMRALYASVPDARKAVGEETAAPAPAGRKKLTRAEAARHASLVRWGKEQPFAARLAAIRERRKAAKGGKGKGKKPAKTPEQRDAERAQQIAANRADVLGKMQNKPNEAALGALDSLRQGDAIDANMGDALAAETGLIQKHKDGSYSLSSAGRAFLNALDQGDAGAAQAAMGRGADTADRQAMREQRNAEREQRKAEREKKGSGGGKKKEAKPEKEADEEHDPTDEATASATASEVGLDDTSVNDLREAADGQGADNKQLRDMGLLDDDGDATAEGVAALDALEAGNPSRYRSAVRRAKARMRRETRQQERENTRQAQRDDRERAKTKEEAQRRTQREQREREKNARSKETRDRMVSAEVERIAAARSRKSMEQAMNDLQPIVDDITALHGELSDLASAEIKAGRRNSTSDQATIDQGYELAMQLCDLFESLGADVGEEEDEEETEVEGGEVEMLEGKVETVYGSDIKALDGDQIGGFAVLFGTEDTPDLSEKRDYFTKSTDYWLDRFGWPRPMTYHHGIDEDTADDPIVGKWTKAVVKDEGIWLEGQLDRAHRYHGAIKELVRRGYLKLSSDSAPQWVVRERKPSGVNEVKRWPLLTASPTVTPAEPRLGAVSFKALIAELGLQDIESNPEAQDTDAVRSDETKTADEERARRLLLRSRLLTLQQE